MQKKPLEIGQRGQKVQVDKGKQEVQGVFGDKKRSVGGIGTAAKAES